MLILRRRAAPNTQTSPFLKTFRCNSKAIASESELETHNMSLSNISILDVYVQIELEESDKNKVE